MNFQFHPLTPRSSQRGMATLAVAMIFLFGMTLVLFFANRSLIFEQRTSANQARATVAYEAAEAGIEWALVKLGNADKIDPANCLLKAAPVAADRNFRDQVVTTTSGQVLTPTGRTAACVLTAAGPVCACPDSGAPAPAAGDGPSFLLQFNAAPVIASGTSQPRLIEVVATGCSSRGSQCISGAGAAADGVASVRILAGMVPMLLNTPASPMTACANIDISGAAAGMNITNTDQEVGGVTINAGGNYITNPSVNIGLSSIAGSPGVASVYKTDPSLTAICPSVTGDPSSMFFAFFGMTKDDYRGMAEQISCTTAADCDSKLTAKINEGKQYFWFNSNLALSGSGTYGSVSKPVAIVVGGTTGSNGAADFSGSIKINGLVYATSQTWNDATGSTYVRGAMVAEGSYTATGSMTVQYDKDVLDALGNSAGSAFARVPGSWRDAAAEL